jgi:type VI secretion system protein VasD
VIRPRAAGVLLLWGVGTAVGTGCGLLGKAPPMPTAPPVTIAAPVAAKPKERTAMTLLAGADANPNREGRPSPVIVRIFQLKTDAAFRGTEFDPLFDDDKKVLADAFVTRDEFTLAPGEKRVIQIELADDTRYVGVLAAFRDIANAEWRRVVQMPLDKEGEKIVLKNLNVTISGKRVDAKAE